MIDPVLYEAYLRHLLAGQRRECMRIVDQLLAEEMPLKTLYLDLFQRSMYAVGELWEANRVSVATEHIASAITEAMLVRVYPQLFEHPRIGRRALTSCLTNEYHQIGAKMVADWIELQGWDSDFLGANTPRADLLRVLEETQPRLLCLSLSLYAGLPALLDVIGEVRERHPRLEILVGGQAFRHGGRHLFAAQENVRFVPDISQLEEILDAAA